MFQVSGHERFRIGVYRFPAFELFIVAKDRRMFAMEFLRFECVEILTQVNVSEKKCMKRGLVERVICQWTVPLRIRTLMNAVPECLERGFVLADKQRLEKIQHDSALVKWLGGPHRGLWHEPPGMEIGVWASASFTSRRSVPQWSLIVSTAAGSSQPPRKSIVDVGFEETGQSVEITCRFDVANHGD